MIIQVQQKKKKPNKSQTNTQNKGDCVFVFGVWQCGSDYDPGSLIVRSRTPDCSKSNASCDFTSTETNFLSKLHFHFLSKYLLSNTLSTMVKQTT